MLKKKWKGVWEHKVEPIEDFANLWKYRKEVEYNISGLSEFCFNCGWHEIENGKCLGCNVIFNEVLLALDICDVIDLRRGE